MGRTAFNTGRYIVKNASLCNVQQRSLIMTRRPLLKRTKVLRKIHNSFPAKPLLNNRANMMDYAYKSRNETASSLCIGRFSEGYELLGSTTLLEFSKKYLKKCILEPHKVCL